MESRKCLYAAAATLLSACNGGGGGGNPPAPPDTAAPVATITSPGNESSTGQGTIVVTGIASDATAIQSVSVNGYEATTNNQFATWEAVVELVFGENRLIVATRDTLGNSTPSAAFILVSFVDAMPPVVMIASPTEAQGIAATTVDVSGTASDDRSLAGVTVNDQAATTTDNFATWTASAVPIVFGSNEIAVVATDNAGNQSSTRVNVERLDFTSPLLAIIEPADLAMTNTSALDVRGTTSDTESGVTSVRVNGIPAVTDDGFATWAASVALESAVTQSIEVIAEDAQGNAATADISVQNGDYLPPAIALIVPSQNAIQTSGDTLFMAGTADGTGSDVVAVTINGMAAQSTDGFVTWTAHQSLDAGMNTFIVQAEDAFGNRSAEISIAAEVTDSPDNTGPETAVLFPPANSKVMSQQITVRGTATDSDGVAYVEVNGVPATSADGFANWQAVIPLVHDSAFEIQVDAQDGAGSYVNGSVVQRVESVQGVIFEFLFTMALDPVSQQLLVVDDGNRIVRLNPDGSGTTISSSDLQTGLVGTGPGITGVGHLVFDQNRDRILAFQTYDSSYVRVIDPATGNREEGFNLGFAPGSIAYDEQNQVVYYTHSYRIVPNPRKWDLYKYEIETATRTRLIQDMSTIAPLFGTPQITFHPQNDSLYMWFGAAGGTAFDSALFTLDPVTFAVSPVPLSPEPADLDTYFGVTADIELTPDGQTIFLRTSFDLLRVDLASGELSSVFDIGKSRAFIDTAAPLDVAYDAQNNDAYLHTARYNVLRLDLDTAELFNFTGKLRGSGDRRQLAGLAWDGIESKWIVASGNALAHVDPGSGDRTIRYPAILGNDTQRADMTAYDNNRRLLVTASDYSGDSRLIDLDLSSGTVSAMEIPSAANPDFEYFSTATYDETRARVVASLAYLDNTAFYPLAFADPAAQQIDVFATTIFPLEHIRPDPLSDRYVTGNFGAVRTIDPDSGDQQLIYGASGEFMDGLALEPNRNSLLTCSWSSYDETMDSLVRIDLVDGSRRVVSGDSEAYTGAPPVGLGPPIEAFSCSIIYDEATGIAYVLADGIHAIDTWTGDRVIISY